MLELSHSPAFKEALKGSAPSSRTEIWNEAQELKLTSQIEFEAKLQQVRQIFDIIRLVFLTTVLFFYFFNVFHHEEVSNALKA